MTVLDVTVGVLLIFGAWSGLLATFVLPRGRSMFGRPAQAVQRWVYLVFVQTSRIFRSYRAKDSLLAAVGPTALIAQLVMFLVLLLCGFALVIEHNTHDLGLAFTESAAALFTVGLAHVAGPANNAATVCAAASGGITIALQIGYLPVIYQSFARRETLVALMESRAGVPAWGPELLARHQLVGSTDALGDFYNAWELWSADLAESHSTHPVLLLFRSAVPGYSWLLSLLATLDAAAIQLAVSPKGAPTEARMCLRMGFSALRRLARTMRWPVNRDPDPEGPIELDYEAFAAAVELLSDIGFPIERSAEEAWPHFRGWRVNYEAVAYRFADYLLAPHAPWTGSRRFLPADVVLPDRPPHRSPGGRTIADDEWVKRVAGHRHPAEGAV